MSTTVAILGATGVVGQKVIALLFGNARFNIIELVASEARVGQVFSQACDWRERLMPLPARIADMRLVGPDNLKAEFVVSCLPSEAAALLEPRFAAQGKMVFSNASHFRMTPNVPLLVAEINADHLSLLDEQDTIGKIITNPNCAAVGITLALAPLMSLGEILHVNAVTLQSVSGAGYPGVPSLDILGNTIPHIEGEVDKITEETKRILGSPKNETLFSVTSHVHRVPVMYGHTVTLHVTFKSVIKTEQALASYAAWNEKYQGLFVLHEREARPQATKDLADDDMRAHIGQLRQGDRPNILGLVCLTHNLVRGAAGAVIANMEAYLDFKMGRHE